MTQIARVGLWRVCGILDFKLAQIAKGSLWSVCGILDFKLPQIAKGRGYHRHSKDCLYLSESV
jgi:hypothetical protein